jgi:hypothetical protein
MESWADNIGDADSQAVQGVGGYQDPHDGRGEYASNFSDLRHNLIIDYIVEPPFASWAGLTNSLARHLVRDWGFQGITAAHSGLPVNITTGGDIGNTLFTQRPNLVPGVPTRLAGRRWNQGVYNAAAYAIPTVRQPGTGYLKGNLATRTERGPRFVTPLQEV